MLDVGYFMGLFDLNDPVFQNGLLLGKISIFLGDFQFDKYSEPLYVSTYIYTEKNVINALQFKHKGVADDSFVGWNRKKWLEFLMREAHKHALDPVEKVNCTIHFGDPNNWENTYEVVLLYDRVDFVCTIRRHLVKKPLEEAELKPKEFERLKSTSGVIKLAKKLRFAPVKNLV